MLKLTTTRQAREFLPEEPMMYYFPKTEGGWASPAMPLRYVQDAAIANEGVLGHDG